MLPCILLSAQLDERIVEQARRAHAYSVLSKIGRPAADHEHRVSGAAANLRMARMKRKSEGGTGTAVLIP